MNDPQHATAARIRGMTAHLHFDADHRLDDSVAEPGRRHTFSFPRQQGQTRFTAGRISRNISFTHSHCTFEQDYEVAIDYDRPTILLVFGLAGCSTFEFVNRQLRHTVRQGDAWILYVDREVLIRRTPARQTSEMIVIRYAAERIGEALEQDGALAVAGSRAVRLFQQSETVAEVRRFCENPLVSAEDLLIAESKALELLARGMAPIARPAALIAAAGKLPEAELARLAVVVELLSSDLTRPPSLRKLAWLAQMSHTKLNRCFQRVYGTTVYDWLRQYRLERAASYLKDARHSITFVALQCGFSSASHFANAFRKCYGCSPNHYRQQHRQAC